MHTPIETLKFSQRTYNALVRNGIESVEQLRETPVSRLRVMRGIGNASLSEIRVNAPLVDSASESLYPYPSIADDDYRKSEKMLVNGIYERLSTEKDPDRRKEISDQLEKWKMLADSPKGYVPTWFAEETSPLSKLTAEDRIRIIKQLDDDLVLKLFPNL